MIKLQSTDIVSRIKAAKRVMITVKMIKVRLMIEMKKMLSLIPTVRAFGQMPRIYSTQSRKYQVVNHFLKDRSLKRRKIKARSRLQQRMQRSERRVVLGRLPTLTSQISSPC